MVPRRANYCKQALAIVVWPGGGAGCGPGALRAAPLLSVGCPRRARTRPVSGRLAACLLARPSACPPARSSSRSDVGVRARVRREAQGLVEPLGDGVPGVAPAVDDGPPPAVRRPRRTPVVPRGRRHGPDRVGGGRDVPVRRSRGVVFRGPGEVPDVPVAAVRKRRPARLCMARNATGPVYSWRCMGCWPHLGRRHGTLRRHGDGAGAPAGQRSYARPSAGRVPMMTVA